MENNMKKYTKSIIALLLAFILIVSSALPIFAVDKDASNQPLVYSKKYNSGDRDTVCTTLDGTSALKYYTDNGYSYDALYGRSGGTLRPYRYYEKRKTPCRGTCERVERNGVCEGL